MVLQGRVQSLYVFDPGRTRAKLRPLVVYLHGCNQTATDAAGGTGGDLERVAAVLAGHGYAPPAQGYGTPGYPPPQQPYYQQPPPGYWFLTADGNVLAYGDATEYGDLESGGTPVDIAATPTGAGYWVVTGEGRVRAFGDAAHLGDASDRSLAAPIAGIAPTPTGSGYHLVTKLGSVLAFGDAR